MFYINRDLPKWSLTEETTRRLALLTSHEVGGSMQSRALVHPPFQ
ncbi:hypothetical protein LEMLEM_LOCUS12219 [Lemmus lemmus]